MPNKYLDSVGLAEYTGLVKDYVDTKADDYLPLAGGTLTGNVYTTPYYDSTIVDPEGGQTLIVSKGKVAKGTAPSNDEWHTMVMAVDNSGLTNNANKYGQVETAVKTDGSVETVLQTYKNEANSTTSAKISVGYDANGNAFTSAPTPTAGDNSTKIATTAFVNTAMANGYLSLSGGTMTGAINMSGSSVNMGTGSNDNGRMYTISNVLRLTGGSNTSTGSYVDVGSPNATNQGVKVTAKNTTNETSLLTTPDGGLFWNDVRIGLQNGTYDLNFYGFGYITASGTSLDMSFPYVAKGKDIRFNSLSATLRSYKGYLSPGGAGGSDILTGSTQGTWYKKDSACPCVFRLVRSGGWGSNGENNTLVVGEFTANVTVTDV